MSELKSTSLLIQAVSLLELHDPNNPLVDEINEYLERPTAQLRNTRVVSSTDSQPKAGGDCKSWSTEPPSEEFKQRIGDCIKDALSSYRCTHTRDKIGDGFQLVYILSPLETVKEGQEELIYLTDHIYNKLFQGPLKPVGDNG